MLKCLLAPAALLYKAGVTFRHRLFDWGILKSEKFDIPVIYGMEWLKKNAE